MFGSSYISYYFPKKVKYLYKLKFKINLYLYGGVFDIQRVPPFVILRHV